MAKQKIKPMGDYGLVLNDDNELLRNFVFISWAESMPDNWRDFILATGIPWYCALHDHDVNDDGSIKKPHYHHVIRNPDQIYVGQIVSFMKALGCNMRPEKPINVSSAVQYLVHLNHTDKYQYPIESIEVFNGATLNDFFYSDNRSVRSDVGTLVEFCERLDIVEFADLVNEIFTGGIDERYFDVLNSHIAFFNCYLRSRAMMGVGSDGKKHDNLSYVNCRRKIGRYYGSQG